MNKSRKIIVMMSLICMLMFTLISDYSKGMVYADNPNDKSTMHSLTGGWDKDFLGTSGKHWTKYGQINNGGLVYASIELRGYSRESKFGTYTSAYVKSSRSVDYYHTHKHSGGMAQ